MELIVNQYKHKDWFCIFPSKENQQNFHIPYRSNPSEAFSKAARGVSIPLSSVRMFALHSAMPGLQMQNKII